MERMGYPSDVGDEEWAFVAGYLTLMWEDAPQREYELREVSNGLRWIIRSALFTSIRFIFARHGKILTLV